MLFWPSTLLNHSRSDHTLCVSKFWTTCTDERVCKPMVSWFPMVPVVSYWDWTTFQSTSTIILWDDHWCMGKSMDRLSSPGPLLSLTTKDLLSRWGVLRLWISRARKLQLSTSGWCWGSPGSTAKVSVRKGALRETRCCMLSAVIAGLYIIMSTQISFLTEETLL